MTFADQFKKGTRDVHRGLFNSSIDNMTKSALKEKAIPNDNIKKLESILNGVYYPKEDDGNKYEEYKNRIMQNLKAMYKEETDEWVSKFIEAISSGASIGFNPRLYGVVDNVSTKDGEYQGVLRKNAETVRSLFNNNKAKILNIIKNPSEYAIKDTLNFQEFYDAGNQAENILQDILTGIGTDEGKFIGGGKHLFIKDRPGEEEEISDFTKKLKFIYEVIDYFQLTGITPKQERGAMWEYGIGALSKDINIDKADVEEDIKNILLGNVTVERGYGGNLENSKVQLYSVIEKIGSQYETWGDDRRRNFLRSAVEKKAKKFNKEMEIKNGNMSIKYTPLDMSGIISAGEPKQGKVDVKITLDDMPSGNGDQTFKISAKNWATGYLGEKYGFGSTAALQGMLRSIGNDLTEKFVFELQDRIEGTEIPGAVSVGHKMARLALILDIVTGFSQGEGHSADTIVINNRQAGCIKVFSAADLITKSLDNIEKNVENGNGLYLSGYDEGGLNSLSRSVFESVRKQFRLGNGFYSTPIYLSHVYGYLNGMIVSAKFNMAN